ncbi:hypothetical protein Celaphus_00009709 [Cervus elaphus hippelaphus]|uniref:Uncharacterized protein n=1 Tax=Cervus elaphus hippelaphus TaxID=46360 RepID=A0A212C0U4_CEREH|nr:hypothetical protein Celaphus_00009709 [Cervus elaphus hippelaphus]
MQPKIELIYLSSPTLLDLRITQRILGTGAAEPIRNLFTAFGKNKNKDYWIDGCWYNVPLTISQNLIQVELKASPCCFGGPEILALGSTIWTSVNDKVKPPTSSSHDPGHHDGPSLFILFNSGSQWFSIFDQADDFHRVFLIVNVIGHRRQHRIIIVLSHSVMHREQSLHLGF